MKLARITQKSFATPRYAIIEGQKVFPLDENYSFDDLNPSAGEGPLYFARLEWRSPLELGEVKLIAPVTPSKIVCVGRNYREHAAELGNKMPDEPLLFLKPSSGLVGPGDQIELPPQSQQVEHEGELGVVIGRTARKLTETDNPLSYVFGYTCINDVTARDLQRKDVQFTRGKGFDTFCPVGPWIITDLDPTNVTVTTRVNGEVKQNGNTRDMAFPVSFLITYISSIMTLYPGDLIATGTPAGVSRMKHGDTVEVEVGGIGILRNSIYDPSAGSQVSG
ncbi:MAG TPA: fumarylacetoacetate hydrolase family protein [Pyrinomonadaceae bacterium]|jgi:2-keto-4-pentenoate hydratase/2-oxohepta-3-ene-1,7-dioic acid hydratase (catechol pathway)|nr:fumarylacetoacetate hydrolase family protein [Pyrinomonadaceae bacterium]